MSLLLNEDFTTYTLRHAYLTPYTLRHAYPTHIHDGVGERLINLNTSVLNNPAFRAAGWTPDNAAIKRCYSPPIPTTGAGVSSAYFQAPGRTTRQGVRLEDGDADGEDGGGRGMVSGVTGSEDTIGAGGMAANERKRRQRTRKEQLDEDDSSDLESDETDEEDKTAAQGIQFRKMPLRDRSKSSPANPLQAELDKAAEDGPGIMITSPSRPPEAIGQGLRRGSLGQVEAIKQRARRDTTTSSEMSSENELDPNAFTRKIPGRPPLRGEKKVHLAERIQEEEELQEREVDSDEAEGDDGLGGDSDLDDDVDEASDLSDEFEPDEATVDSPSLLNARVAAAGISDDTSPLKKPPDMPIAAQARNRDSTSRTAAEEDMLNKPLPKLPPGRPLSAVPPPSLLTAALKGPTSGSGSSEKPFQRFADLYGKDEASPLWIKIYAPFSETPTDPIEVPIKKFRDGQAQPQPVTVAELIGLALWRYNEEEYKPPVDKHEDISINRWTLRIVEDEEVDFDFEPLQRTRPLTDFTSNNNRPPQRRARDKPWDEFGLVRATDEQFKVNEELTPQMGANSTPSMPPSIPPTPRSEVTEQQSLRPGPQRGESEASTPHISSQIVRSGTPAFKEPYRNPITGPSLAAAALRKETGSTTLLDLPQREHAQSTPRTGAPKTVTLSYTDPNSFATSNVKVDTTADTYIAEIFDYGCQKLNLDKALHILKVHGTQTVAPSDRTVEALGEKLHLDLVRRRFIGAGMGAGDGVLFGLGLSGSPGSSSPNAPLELNPAMGAPGSGGGKKKGKTSAPGGGIQKFDASNLTSATLHNLLGGPGSDFGGKRYAVLRKQPLSFAPSHPRTLIITPEYLQILPAAPDSLAAPSGKVTNVPMTSIIGVKVSRKHPKMVRVLVYREKEKRYDFEAQNREEANAIMVDVRRGIEGVVGEGAGVY